MPSRVEDSVEIIENGVFASCRSLQTVSFPASLKRFPGWAFFGSNNIRRVQLRGSVADIGERAFSGCENLQSMDFPDGLKK